MKELLISIIIPCYNGEKHIAKTLNSVLEQTYSNWECIVINDGSTDNSEAVIKNSSLTNPKIKYFKQNNKGLSETRNVGMDHSKGEFIFFLDADDLLSKTALFDLYKLTQEQEVDVVYGKIAITSGQNTTVTGYLQHSPPNNKVLFNKNKSLIPTVLNEPLICVAWNRLYKKRFLIENAIRFQKNILHEDELWHFEVLFHANSIILSDKVTHFYNFSNPDSITNNFKLKNIESYLFILDFIYEKYYRDERYSDYRDRIAAYLIYLQIITIQHTYKKLPNADKQKSKSNIITVFNKLKNVKRSKPILNKKEEALQNRFQKFSHKNPDTIAKILKYHQSKSIRKKLAFYILLLKEFF